MASSSLYHLSPFRPYKSPSSSSSSFRRDVSVPVACSASRRLALIQLGTVIPQSQLFGVNASTLLKSDGNMTDVSTVANTAKPLTEENALDWLRKDKRRMLHVVYRVGDLEKTIKFYTECLGMKLLRQRNIPEERYANAFLGYGPEESNFVIELTYNYGVDKYDIGTGFGHFGIAVEDVAKTVDLVKAKGGKVTREPGPLKGSSTVIALIEDPNGYKFELLERKSRILEPLCEVMLRVGDIDRSIKFYQQAYGMDLLRKKDDPENKYTIAVMGYGSEDVSAVLELTYNYGITEYDRGNGYGQIAIGTDDVYKTAEVVKLFGGDIVLEPGPLPVINTKITACVDPDGWKSVFVDNVDFMKELE
ncbi:probable lactoylglutathione lyase, chloroplastic [Cynara cardunculus var. scolymus]|uniref:probable lactoylglutathione lyase, chloroplastic n=1 Tax=Cynara cardunculus var. scolymus TaxID=59895 RepID=UPI000D62A1F1|nr:probable lactoylglutathione lyase, chloroplastic [Cynara cardunculus var. scolymus]